MSQASEKKILIGAMLWRVVRNAGQSLVVAVISGHSDVLLVNQRPLYIKTTTKRTSPWRFTFSVENLECISMLQKNSGECIASLICGYGGDVCLNDEQLSRIVNLQSHSAEWIGVHRDQGKQYSVSGNLGKLTGKIPVNSFPRQFLS